MPPPAAKALYRQGLAPVVLKEGREAEKVIMEALSHWQRMTRLSLLSFRASDSVKEHSGIKERWPSKRCLNTRGFQLAGLHKDELGLDTVLLVQNGHLMLLT